MKVHTMLLSKQAKRRIHTMKSIQKVHLPLAESPESRRFPFESKTGYFDFSASILTVYFARTSGLSKKYVIPLNPSASHCVQ